ncbi:MAG TPA: DoxX family protein [Gemmatimonadaceae bacterium]
MAARIGTDRQAQIGLGIVRIVAGIVFMAHGYQKFFTMGIPGVTGFFGGLGIPLPGVAAPMVATLELVGGFLLVIGLFARFIAIPLAIDMATAIALVHAKNGFYLPMGVEFVLMLMTAAIAVAIAGSGAFSIDRATSRSNRRT